MQLDQTTQGTLGLAHEGNYSARTLPCNSNREDASVARQADSAAPKRVGDPYRVLIVDDDSDVHEHFRAILGERFHVDCASQGQDGLALLNKAFQEQRPYAVAFVDARMPPGWDGIETIRRFWDADAALEIVMCTALTDLTSQDIARQLPQSHQFLVLKKPFDNIEAYQLALTLSEKWRLNRQAQSSFNNLEAQLRQSQKMESIGQLAGGIAHDFNNLLTVINGHASLISVGQNLSAKAADSLKEILEAGKRASALTRQLMTFSRKQEFRPQVINLNEAVNTITKMLRRILGEDITLHVDFFPRLPSVKADLGMIEQVLLNLAVNSRDAMPHGGKLRIKTSALFIDPSAAQQNPEAAPGHYVCLSFADTGCGIAPEILPRIFEPFFTTKQMGRGTGLGLATVYGIVKQHQGWIAVQSNVGAGTTFQIYIPASSAPSAPVQMTLAEQTVIGGTETILVVEDEAPLLKLVLHILESHGYKVIGCGSGRQALEVWREQQERIDLLLTDLILPNGMTGTALAAILQKSKPSLKVLFTSGYNAERLAQEILPGVPVNLLQKPFHARKLAEMVFQTLNAKA